jgi:hypothetical protein
MRKLALRRLLDLGALLALGCLLGLSACVINPVPTPGVNQSAGGGGWAGPGDVGAAIDSSPSFADVAPLTVEFTAKAADPLAQAQAGGQLAAWATGPSPSGRLVVLLPTAGQGVAAYAGLVQAAAAYGHRVLVLDGPWTQDVPALCGGDLGCQEAVRQEQVDGQDHGSQVTIQAADGLAVRLLRALQWLAQNRPEGGWQSFVVGNEPAWPSVVLLGHGTAGGAAMMLAAQHAMARVGLLDAPDDGNAQGAAPWLAKHATPSAQIRGFAHLDSPKFGAVAQAWTALGLGGKADRVDVDSQSPPYAAWRQLTTAADCDVPSLCVAQDGRYRDVWRALVGTPY